MSVYAGNFFGENTSFELQLEGEYADVVARLQQHLPIDVMFQWFSSADEKIKFPYQSIDSNLLVVHERLESMKYAKEAYKRRDQYEYASTIAARTLAWIDIGRQGLEPLSANPDVTSNWTAGLGQTATAEERAQYIRTEGKDWLTDIVREYLATRDSHVQLAANDVFTKHKLEFLLDNYRE